jgi:hypothetical protein
LKNLARNKCSPITMYILLFSCNWVFPFDVAPDTVTLTHLIKGFSFCTEFMSC